jgi:hypothetical protein
MIIGFVAAAWAQSLELTHQGRILSPSGQPIAGSHTVNLALYAAGSGGAALWSRDYPVDAIDGYFTVTLDRDGANVALDPAWFGSDVWIETKVDGVVLPPRSRLTDVPTAGVAHTARHVAITGAPSGTTCSDPGAIVFDTTANGLRVCSGGQWVIAGGTPSTNPVFGGADGDGINEADAGASCATIKFDFPSSTSGAYWINPKGTGAYRVWCDMETLGGGWTLVAKVQGNNPTMNRNNTAQWRNRTYIGNLATIGSENMLGRTYEDMPFTDVMVRSIDTPERHLAWRHPALYPSVYSIVNAGQRVSDGALLGGSVQNLMYPGYPDVSNHNGCRALKYGFFGFDDAQTGNGAFVGHTGLWTGHSGAVVGASLFYDGNAATYLVDTNCITDFGLGSAYGAGGSGDDAYAINAHWWGNANSGSYDWGSHALFVRHVVGDADQGLKNGTPTNPARSCKEINTLHGPGLPSTTYWLEPANGAYIYPAYCDMSTDGGGWTLVAKLRGSSPTMNRRQVQVWRERQYVGSIANLVEEDAIGQSYEHVPFTDVLLKGIQNPGKQLAWRHPASRPSVFSIVDAGTRVSDGAVLFGSFANLDSCGSHMNLCSAAKYGFLGFDDNQFVAGNYMGHTMPSGHSGGVVAVSIFYDGNGATNGVDYQCVTDFGFGSGYGESASGDDAYALNAHWWGNANTGSNCWRSHAFYVR